MPSFCGTKTGNATSSRKIMRAMKLIADSVVPSYGQLKPVGTSSLEPVRSIVISSPAMTP